MCPLPSCTQWRSRQQSQPRHPVHSIGRLLRAHLFRVFIRTVIPTEDMDEASSRTGGTNWSFTVDINLEHATPNRLLLFQQLMRCEACVRGGPSQMGRTLCPSCCASIIPELRQELEATVLETGWTPTCLGYIQAFFPENRVTVRVNEGGVQHVSARGYFQLSHTRPQTSLTRWIQRVGRVSSRSLAQDSAYRVDMKKISEGAAIPLLQQGTLALHSVNKAKVLDRAQMRDLIL